MKVFQTVEVKGKKFGILLDSEEKTAYEAVWDEQHERWETDFSYESLGVESDEVAGSLDFDEVRKMGYSFAE